MTDPDDSQQQPHRKPEETQLPKGGSILDGVANILGRLGELAEKGEELRRQVGAQGAQDSDARGVFDFAVRFGNMDQASPGRSTRPGTGRETPVRPMRSAAPKNASKTPVEKVRKAVIDTFEEDDHLLIVAEMPGATADSIQVELQVGKVALKGANANAVFEGEVELATDQFEPPEHSLNNGMLEVRLKRRQAS